MTSLNKQEETLLERIGGRDALRATLDEFYIRMTKDKRLEHYFVGVDINLLKWHQYNFMSIAFTSVPKGFNVETLITEKHRRLIQMGLDESHFDMVARQFVETLKSQNNSLGLIDDSVGVIGPLSFFILLESNLFTE